MAATPSPIPSPLAGAGLTPLAPGDVDMAKEARLASMVCSIENKDECVMCGS